MSATPAPSLPWRCGTKIVHLEPHQVDNTAIAEFDHKSDAVLQEGYYIQCYIGYFFLPGFLFFAAC